MSRIELLGLPLDAVDTEAAIARIDELMARPGLDPVVTLNPEIVVRARAQPELARAVRRASLVTPDGVGILWAARRLCGLELGERVTGVDLVTQLLERHRDRIRVFFLGGRPGVAERAAEAARRRFGTRVAGAHHGYFEDPSEVVPLVAAARPDLLLVGLGERQEVFVEAHREELGARVAIGVGGTLDVLAGAARRAPELTRRLGIEWAWRVGTDPRRWRRAPRLLAFVLAVEGARLRGSAPC